MGLRSKAAVRLLRARLKIHGRGMRKLAEKYSNARRLSREYVEYLDSLQGERGLSDSEASGVVKRGRKMRHAAESASAYHRRVRLRGRALRKVQRLLSGKPGPHYSRQAK